MRMRSDYSASYYCTPMYANHVLSVTVKPTKQEVHRLAEYKTS